MKERVLNWKYTPCMIVILHCCILIFFLICPLAYDSFHFFNMLLYFPVAGLLLLLLPYKASCVINAVLIFGMSYLNDFLRDVRGRPLNFSDVYCIQDGLNVADRYSLIFGWGIALKLLLAVSVTVAAVWLLRRYHPKQNQKRFCRLIGSTVITVCSVLTIALCSFTGMLKVYPSEWNEEVYTEALGLFYAVYCEYQNNQITEPENWSAEEAQGILESYESEAGQITTDSPEHIIVIMNEALTDYALTGRTNTISDPLEHIHALDKNCIKGKMAVNVYGGTTCNTEFEFLTGYSLMFLPGNAIPYIQYDLADNHSIALDLKENGYAATAFHPFFANGWRRHLVYQNFGFDTFISAELFSDSYQAEGDDYFYNVSGRNFGDNLEYIRGFISDAECYRIVMQEKETSQKTFSFAVTIQNHSDYNIEGFEDAGMTTYLHTQDADMEQYLNLCRISDTAFNDFLTMLEGSPEKTVVLMFGDHQPPLDFNYYTERYADSGNEYQQYAENYIVPYVMWANYDVDWEEHEFISANYLSALLKQNCNFPLTAFDNLRLAAMEEYPVITYGFSVTKDGEYVSSETAKQSTVIQDYEWVQYLLFNQ